MGKVIKHLCCAILVIITPGCDRRSDTELLDEIGFASAFTTKLESLDPSLTLEPHGELEVSVRAENDSECIAFLENAFREYQMVPEALDDVLEKYALSTLSTLEASGVDAIVRTNIVPVIKDKLYPLEVKRSLEKRGHWAEKFDFYYEKLNEDLLVFYAIDSEHNISFLNKEDVESLDLDSQALRQLAINNLDALLPNVERSGGDGIYMVTAGGTYEASLLLFDSVWNQHNFDVKGEIVVAIPTRDVLFVTGSEDHDGLKRVREYAQDIFDEGGYVLTPDLFVWRSSMWVPMDGKE